MLSQTHFVDTYHNCICDIQSKEDKGDLEVTDESQQAEESEDYEDFDKEDDDEYIDDADSICEALDTDDVDWTAHEEDEDSDSESNNENSTSGLE